MHRKEWEGRHSREALRKRPPQWESPPAIGGGLIFDQRNAHHACRVPSTMGSASCLSLVRRSSRHRLGIINPGKAKARKSGADRSVERVERKLCRVKLCCQKLWDPLSRFTLAADELQVASSCKICISYVSLQRSIDGCIQANLGLLCYVSQAIAAKSRSPQQRILFSD
jgi:hypothetical protein